MQKNYLALFFKYVTFSKISYLTTVIAFMTNCGLHSSREEIEKMLFETNISLKP